MSFIKSLLNKPLWTFKSKEKKSTTSTPPQQPFNSKTLEQDVPEIKPAEKITGTTPQMGAALVTKITKPALELRQEFEYDFRSEL